VIEYFVGIVMLERRGRLGCRFAAQSAMARGADLIWQRLGLVTVGAAVTRFAVTTAKPVRLLAVGQS